MKKVINCFKLIVPNARVELLLFLLIALPVYLIPSFLIFIEKQIVEKIVNSSQVLDFSMLLLILILPLVYGIMTWLDRKSKRYLEFNLFHSVLIFLSQTIRDKIRVLKLEYFETSKLYQKINLAEDATTFIAFTLSTTLFIGLNLVSVLAIGIYLASIKLYLLALLLITSLSVYLDIYQESVAKADLLRETIEDKRTVEYMINSFSNDLSKDIKVTGASSFILNKINGAINNLISNTNSNINNVFKKTSMIVFAKLLVQSFTYLVVLRLFLYQKITLAEFTATLTALIVVSQTMNQFFSFLGNLTQFSILSDPYFELLNIDDSRETKPGLSYRNECVFEFKNVCFKYPNTEEFILEDVSFKVMKGDSVAIAGINGAGKTTIIKLMSGVYLPISGVVLFNGVDTRDINEYDITSQFTSISQTFGKYKFSVNDNILISDINIKDEIGKPLNALKWSGLDKKLKLDTSLGKEFGGIDLSGGDWQRLALSRSYYRKRNIYMFDEPTSSLDPMFEVLIFDKIEELSADETSVLVSHRLGALRKAGMIIVLNSKKVVEVGNFNELVESKSYFFEMWNSQKMWYK